MTAILNALRWDVIVQARNGFYWASAFLIVVMSALLLSCARDRARQFRTLGPGHPGHQPPDHHLLLRRRPDAPRARRGDAQRPRRLAALRRPATW